MRALPIAAFCCAALPVLFVAAPLLGEGPGVLLGHPTGDLADHLQGALEVGDALLAGEWPDQTRRSHVPDVVPLVYPDPVGALLVTALRPLGVAAAWNGALLLQIAATGLVGFGLGAHLLASRRAGLVVGIALATSPYLLGLLHGGLAEYVGVASLIAAIGALLRALELDPQGRPGGPRWVAAAGLLGGLAFVQAAYHGLFVGLVGLCALPGPGLGRRLRALVGAGLLGGLVATPWAWALLGSLGAGGAVHAGNAPGWRQATAPMVDLLGFVRPGAHYFPDTPALGNPGILQVHYLGAVLLGLAIVGAWREPTLRRRWGPLTLGLGLLALGPALCVAGARLVPLPLALLYLPGSPFSLLHHPYRLVAALLPLLALFAAAGLRRAPGFGLAAALTAMLAETVLASPAPWPVATTRIPVVAGLEALPPGHLLDWPPDASTANRQYQLAQAGHGRPIPYGVNVFLPDRLREDELVASLFAALDDAQGRARNRDVPGARLRRVGVQGPRLRAWGFVGVALHEAHLTAAEAARARAILEGALGAPVGVEGGVALFVLR